MKLRKNRNPRYQEALNLAKENNVLAKKQTEHNFQNILNLSNLDSEVMRIGGNLKKLTNSTLTRNEKLTDSYITLSGRYWVMLNRLEARKARLDLVTRQLKNYVPDHWLFEEESAGDAEDNNSEPEPEPQQMEFDFGEEFKPTKH